MKEIDGWNLIEIERNKFGKTKVFFNGKSVRNFKKEPHYVAFVDNFNSYSNGSLNGQGDYISAYIKLADDVETILRNLIREARLRRSQQECSKKNGFQKVIDLFFKKNPK